MTTKRKQQERATAWRAAAHTQARHWWVRLEQDRLDAPAPVDTGLVLGPDERVLGRVPCRMAERVVSTWIVNRKRPFTGLLVTGGLWRQEQREKVEWRDLGGHEFVVTDWRIVCRDLAGPYGVVWPAVCGVTVDLAAEVVDLDVLNDDGSQFAVRFTGPTVAPIAVAAVALCQGRDALRLRPELTSLWPNDDLDGVRRASGWAGQSTTR